MGPNLTLVTGGAKLRRKTARLKDKVTIAQEEIGTVLCLVTLTDL